MPLFDILLMLHVLSVIIWVGGMFFAYFFLRPASAALDLESRLTLWANVLSRFFPVISFCILIIFATGFYLIYLLGGFVGLGNYINIMMLLGFIMLFIFKYAYVKPYRALKKNVAQQQWQQAAIDLSGVRTCVAINLALGIITIVLVIAFRAW